MPSASVGRLAAVLGVAAQVHDVRGQAPLTLESSDGWVVTDAGGARELYADETSALIGLAGDLELYAAEHVPGRIAVHAGVVAIEGRAIVVPGRSMAGKSTMVRALLAAGADYLSDEYALLDENGRVHAYPRPLRLRGPQGTEVVAPETLGAVVPSGSVAVGLVAALTHDASAGWAVGPMTVAEATLVLLDNAVAARSRSAEALTACAAASRAAAAVRGTRGEADEAARRLIDLVRGTA